MGTKKRHRDQLQSFTTTTFWLLRDAQRVSQRPRGVWKGRTKPHLSLGQDFLLVQLEGSSYSSPYNRWLLPGIQGVFSWQLSRQLLQAQNAVSHPGDAAAEPCPCKTPHSPSTLQCQIQPSRLINTQQSTQPCGPGPDAEGGEVFFFNPCMNTDFVASPMQVRRWCPSLGRRGPRLSRSQHAGFHLRCRARRKEK